MFLDANVFIHAYDSTEWENKDCKSQLKRIIKGEMRAQTSVMVLNEVLHFFLANRGKERARIVFSNIRRIPNLAMLPVDEEVLGYVIRFIDDGLGTTDAYHAATMVANGVDVICSYDGGFDKAKGIRRQVPK